MTKKVMIDDIDALLDALPPHIAAPLRGLSDEEKNNLLEVILDLGRLPEARFMDRGDVILSEQEVRQEDLEYVVRRIGQFGGDNRAGIERTLHRISAIRNRQGKIIGLTCRVGRAVFGTIDIIRDLVESGRSILLLGRPGVGKTTMLREVARVLADDLRKRVVVVDTSNEIAGDGDIPHPGIGRARRMQVPRPELQHAVMIEAVENHMPEVIIIDEIGTELEAAAARTIAERGVQLIATAHGNTLENLMLNPTLSDLVGGIQSVTLSDEEARRRGTQKTILERKAPPTFDVIVEIQSWDRVAVHKDTAQVVDALLRGQPIPPEIRYRDAEGKIHVERPRAVTPEHFVGVQTGVRPGRPVVGPSGRGRRERGTRPLRIFPYGVSRSRLERAIDQLEVPAVLVRDLRDADAVLTLKHLYRKRGGTLERAQRNGVPVYVLRTNTLTQIQAFLRELFGVPAPEETAWEEEVSPEEVEQALAEAEAAVREVLQGREAVELSPQRASIRRLQHELARRYQLRSRSEGEEPYRRVRIFRP